MNRPLQNISGILILRTCWVVLLLFELIQYIFELYNLLLSLNFSYKPTFLFILARNLWEREQFFHFSREIFVYLINWNWFFEVHLLKILNILIINFSKGTIFISGNIIYYNIINLTVIGITMMQIGIYWWKLSQRHEVRN